MLRLLTKDSIAAEIDRIRLTMTRTGVATTASDEAREPSGWPLWGHVFVVRS